uniref:Uncharacterized protein n=1 Tax=Rhizophora mucronata TaxID=61149 RepID=A0A2P2QFF2_RHIMU
MHLDLSGVNFFILLTYCQINRTQKSQFGSILGGIVR